MAVLTKGDERLSLPAHGVLGRSSGCAVRLASSKMSSEHARISYRDGAWTVRDLSSKNGTFVNGEGLARGAARALSRGDRLAFGDPAEEWVLSDDSAPTAIARRLTGGAVLVAEDGILALPSPANPIVTLFAAPGRR